VTQAASTPVSGPDTVVVLATEQSFDDEIAQRLERVGYRDRDGVLVTQDSAGPGSFPAVGGQDGVVVLARDARTVQRTLDGEQPDGPTRELLGEIDAPVRDATTLAGASCVRGVGLGDSVDPPEVELVMRVEGEAHADRLGDPRAGGDDSFRPGDATAEGASPACR
jgi:hypothetical protein